MKKKLNYILTAALALVLISWGGVGHKTVATIAENHLNAEAKTSIKALLGDQSIADIASWADEVRNTPEYKSTGPLHYVDLPLGYTYDEFAAEVKKQGEGNVHGAILKYEAELQSNTTPNEEKTIALKFWCISLVTATSPCMSAEQKIKEATTSKYNSTAAIPIYTAYGTAA